MSVSTEILSSDATRTKAKFTFGNCYNCNCYMGLARPFSSRALSVGGHPFHMEAVGKENMSSALFYLVNDDKNQSVVVDIDSIEIYSTATSTPCNMENWRDKSIPVGGRFLCHTLNGSRSDWRVIITVTLGLGQKMAKIIQNQEKMEVKVADIQKKMEKVEVKVADIQKKMEAKVAEMQEKMEAKVAENQKKLEAKVAENQKKMEAKVAENEKKLEEMEAKVAENQEKMEQMNMMAAGQEKVLQFIKESQQMMDKLSKM